MNDDVFVETQEQELEKEPQDNTAAVFLPHSRVNQYNAGLDESINRLSAEFEQERNFARAMNIENGLATDPVKWGKAKRIAERRNTDVDLVFNNFEEFEAKDKELLLADIVNKNSALKELSAESPEFMKLAANDCDKLQEISNNLTIFGTMEKPIKPVAIAKTAAYLYNENEKRLELYEAIGDLMSKDDAESQAKLAVLVDEANKTPLIDTSGLEDTVYNTIEQLPYMKRTMVPKVGLTLALAGAEALSLAKTGAAGGAAAGSVAPGGGTALGAVVGGVGGMIVGTSKGAAVGGAIGTAIAFKNTYDIESGAMFANLAVMKDENGQGFDRSDMVAVARTYGALSAAVELFPMEKMARIIPGYNEAKKGMIKAGFKKAVREALKDKTKAQLLRGIIKDISVAAGSEGLEEAVQELLQVIGERHLQDKYNDKPGYNFEKATWNDDIARIGNAGYQGFKASLIIPITGGTARAYMDVKAYNEMRAIDSLQRGDGAKAELDAARMDNVHNHIQKIGELKEQPEQLKAFLQRATRQSDIRDIYLSIEDAKAILQSEAVKKNEKTLQKLGVLDSIRRQIGNQQDQGGAVKISFADYGATVMSNKELYGAFKDVVKTYEDGMTMNELRQKQKSLENIVAEGKKLKEQNQSDFEYIYDRLLENAAVAGIASEQAKTAAELNAYFYLGLSRLHNMSPIQMFQNDSLNFDYKIDGKPARSAQLDKIVEVIRDEQIKGADQNLLRASRVVARKDVNAIKKTLMAKIENPNTADVKEYIRLLNTISDMKINLAEMSNEDFAKQLKAYTAQSPITVDIARSDADKIKSGIFSASEKALADIQDKGATGDYVLVGGGRVPVNYEIVELGDLVTSHNADGAVNEAFPQELQPRDRSRSASDAQINEIVNNFAPDRVAKAPTATEGAPIVTQNNVVAVGNGRAMAISKVYENAEKAEQYRNYLTEQGYDVENFAEPVLVRKLAIDLDNNQLRALVDDANTAGTMQYSDAEKAVTYSKKLTGEIIDLLDTDAELESAANRRFVREFFANVVPTAERNAFLDKDDRVTKKGIEMIENTLTAIIVPDTRFLSVLVENPDNNIRKVTSGLAKAAPAIVAFENDILSGQIDAKYSIAPDIRQAVEILKRAKDKGQNLDLYVKQLDLLEGHIPAEVLAVADLFDKSRSAVDFADKIKNYIHNATEQGDLTQGNMFGIEPVAKIALLERMNAQAVFNQGKITDNAGAVELTINTAEEMAGVSEDEFKQKMLDTLKSFKGNRIFNQSLGGEIEIRTSSIKKYKSFFADKNKRLIVPYIPELLAKARFVSEKTYTPLTERNIVAYWKADLPINIDSDTYNVHLTVKQDNNGNFFWDAQVQEKAPQTVPATNPGVEGLKAEQSAYENSISLEKKEVNKSFYQLPVKTYKNGKADIVNIESGAQYYQVAKENAKLDAENPAYDGETININGQEKTVYNSEGQRIAKSKEALENFYRWFGDSKVVDKKGRPLVVYHGTRADFDTFDKEKIGKGSYWGQMFYFGKGDEWIKQKGYSVSMPVYLQLKNPFVLKNKAGSLQLEDILGKSFLPKKDIGVNDSWAKYVLGYRSENPEFFSEKMQQAGYDGLIVPKYNIYGAFEPNQIKSTQNRGTYSESENIYYQREISDEELEADLAEFDKILDSFAEENKEYYNKKGKFEDAKKIQKKYQNYFMYNIADASNPRGIHDPFYFEYDGKKDITNIFAPKKLEKNSSIILYRGAEQIFIPVTEFDENKFKKLGYKRQKKFAEGLRDVYTLNKDEANDRVYFQSAFAGSRVDYDRPSLEAIGSGEGNQVHGWGLYYALNRNVAESYRKAFLGAQSSSLRIQDKSIGDFLKGLDGFIGYYDGALLLLENNPDMNPREYFIKALNEYIIDFKEHYQRTNIDTFKKCYEKAEAIKAKAEKLTDDDFTIKQWGQVHEVDLPENPYLLDEQKMLGEQSPLVKKALREVAKQVGVKWDNRYDNGKYIYNNIANVLGSQKTASQMLEKYGIKGITYDGREDGRCFVIFNPKDVKVIQKFYQQQADEALGAYSPTTRTITLFKNANLSTLIHESGHFWREMIRKYAAMDGASEQLKAYNETLENWLDSEWSKHNEVFVQPDGSYTLFYNGEKLQEGFTTYDEAVETAKHECFARAVEKYFRTAEAPSFSLRKLFTTFKRWLCGVYKDAAALNVDISPEVKNIFDRLLASDGEIEQYVLEKRIRQLFDAPDKANMSQKQFDAYKQYMDNMLTVAKDDYYKSVAALEYKEKTAEFKSKKEALRHDVLMEFSNTSENRFIIALVYGVIGDTKVDIKANASEIKQIFNRVVENGADRLPKRLDGSAIFADDGMSIAELSDFFGLSEDIIKKQLSQSPKLVTAIEDTLRYRVHEELGSPVSYAEVEAQIVKSLHNKQYFDMLSLDLSKISPNPENQGAMEHALQARAEDIIGKLRITDIKPEKYFNQSLKAGDNAIAALSRGNKNAAYSYKRQQLMNFFLYKEAQKQADNVEKTVRRLKEIGKKEVNSAVNQQHQDAVRAILGRYSLANALTKQQKERLGSLAKFIEEQRAAGYDIDIPVGILESMDKKPYTEMSVDELLSMADLVKNIIHNGREIKTYELAGLQVEKEKLLSEIAAQLAKSYKLREQSKTGKQEKHFLKDFAATVDENLVTLGGLCERLDDNDSNGVFHRAFLRPLSEAQNVENELLQRYGKKMNELNQKLSEETKAALFENVTGAKEALGADYTLGELISIGLNMGNYYNKQRMMANFGTNYNDALEWVAQTLTKEQWDYIQGVWDLLDSMYPMLAEHQKKMSGLDMDQVVATPVVTPYGVYRGGYYPIVYDKTASMEARDKNSAETALLESDYGRATTAKGYTKSRLDRVDAPLKFGLAPISQHIASVIHDVAYRQTIRQLWNLANSPTFMETFDLYLAPEYRDGICQLLKTLANQPNRDARAIKGLDACLKIIRNRTTTLGLAFRLTTAVAQTLGFYSSVAALDQRGRKKGAKHSGTYWLWRGIKAFAQSAENREWALANSGELRARLNNNDVNIAEAMKGIGKEITRKEKVTDSMVKAGFWLIGKIDFVVAQTTWFAAYEQAKNEFGYEHQDAVFYADRIMIDSQGTGNLKDTPLFQRNGEIYRSMAMFYSPFAGLYQIWTQAAKDIKDNKQFTGAVHDLFIALILPPLVEGLLKGDAPDGDDDLSEWLKYLLCDPLFYWLSTIPIARDAASVMEFGRVPGSLYANAANTIWQPIKRAYKLLNGKDVKGSAFVKDLMNAVALGTGIPIGGQVADWTSYGLGAMTGNVNMNSPADVIYGIYRGKERKDN